MRGIGRSQAVVTACALILLLLPAALAQSSPRAFIITDLAPSEDLTAELESWGWETSTSSTIEIESYADLVEYDAVWIPAHSTVDGLQFLTRDAGDVERFVLGGGIVVIWSLAPETMSLDIAPGGPDAEPVEAPASGALVIAAPDHSLIDGEALGGVSLSVMDLDPTESGGSAFFTGLPHDADLVVLAENADGPVFLEYTHGSGRVLLSALRDEGQPCRHNTALYVESLLGSP
jgi:hypothetical protein